MGDPITQTVLAAVGLKSRKKAGVAAPVAGGGPPGTQPGTGAPGDFDRRKRRPVSPSRAPGPGTSLLT